MTQDFTPAGSWSAYPHLTIDAFIQQFPDVAARESEACKDEGDVFRDKYKDRTIILVKGNVSVSQAQFKELMDVYALMLAVDGSLSVDGNPSKLFYVSGDLHCRSVSFGGEWLWLHYPVGGRIVAKDCAWLVAEDHEVLCSAPRVRLETRFLFSWFYNLNNLDLSPETVIFILAGWSYCSSLDFPNPIFSWHDGVFVLQDRFVYRIDCDSSDAFDWDNSAIDTALRAGENIFREGFDIACMTYQRAADKAMSLEDYRRAYSLYKKSASLSPMYYEAWFGMADALHQADAYAQAMVLYREAAARFPADQTGLVNAAANYGALCAIRCRHLDVAIDLATISINHTCEGYYNRDLLAPAYRFRAEAYLLSGREEEAFQDLEKALSYDDRHATANWLMGLLYYRRNDLDRARQYHRQASNRDADFSVYYDQAGNTDFLGGAAIEVDWDKDDNIAALATLVKDERRTQI